jgi:hypothetical protein
MRTSKWYNQFLYFVKSYHPIVHSLLIGTILARMASSMSLPFLAIYLLKQTDMNAVMIGLVIGAGSLAGTLGGFIGELFLTNSAAENFFSVRCLVGALYFLVLQLLKALCYSSCSVC